MRLRTSLCLIISLQLFSCGSQEPAEQIAPEPSAALQGSDHEAGGANADERAALAAGSALPQPVTATELLSCEAVAGMTAYCGFKNPEDLVQIPGTELLIVSEMGEFMADSPGTLSLLDMQAGLRQTLTIDWALPAENWGDPDCPAPDSEAFSPHGIDLTARADGGTALLVVNHGKRESVEFFAVAKRGDLQWRGCALPPEDPFINDVAARRDGGFYVTHMWNKNGSFEETVAALQAGQPTGWVWAWQRDSGFTRLPNTDDLMPNGIALSADNNTLYVNVYMGGKTFALDLGDKSRVAEAQIRQADNVTVDADGAVWVASHQHDPIGQACTQVADGPCLLPFKIEKADPVTLSTTTVLDHDGPPMGYATVALRVGNKLYLGSAHGDRVVSIDL
ncbi:MAG: SMP-30/gluconolactonase/LRE family protein [Pseudomonadota bacterium]